MDKNYQLIENSGSRPIKAWIRGVPVEDQALAQLKNIASLPIIYSHVAAMPDVHLGIGATVGSVIPTQKAIIPAAVGVDIGCGVMAAQTSLKAKDLPDSLRQVREEMEKAIPHGRTQRGSRGDRGAWHNLPAPVLGAWKQLAPGLDKISSRHPQLVGRHTNTANHLGTLGTGNHFVELCLDEVGSVWIMLHSGSRGIGNRIGSYFIEKAKQDMRVHWKNLPDENLAYFEEGTKHFQDYVEAVGWAQDFARINRELMMKSLVWRLKQSGLLPPFELNEMAVNCHHNYVQEELHFGNKVFVTRKGAIRAGLGELGIIPGSMGAKSFIVRGRGNVESFESCSHGAGRLMSRGEAKRTFSLEDHALATQGVECRKDTAVLDETPMAYKPIEAVMEAQSDLVEVVHTLKQVVCVKG